MKTSPWLLAALLVSTQAWAQPFAGEVDDRAVLFSRTDIEAFQQPRPYRLRVLTERDPQGGAGLLERAKAAVDSTKTVVVAIDPEHRKTHVRFGSDTGVKSRDFDAISAAGNGEFRDKQWGPGVLHILAQADASRANQLSAAAVSVTTVHETPTIAYIGMGTAGLALAAFGAFLVWNRRRERRFNETLKRAGEEADRKRDEANALMARNLEEEKWHDDMAVQIRKDAAMKAASMKTAITNADWLARNKASVLYKGQWVALNEGILVDNDMDRGALETKLAGRADRDKLLVLRLEADATPAERAPLPVERPGTWNGNTSFHRPTPPARFPAAATPLPAPVPRARVTPAPLQSTTVVALVSMPEPYITAPEPVYIPTPPPAYTPPAYTPPPAPAYSPPSYDSGSSSSSSSSSDSGSSSSYSSFDSGSSSSFGSSDSGGGSSSWLGSEV